MLAPLRTSAHLAGGLRSLACIISVATVIAGCSRSPLNVAESPRAGTQVETVQGHVDAPLGSEPPPEGVPALLDFVIGGEPPPPLSVDCIEELSAADDIVVLEGPQPDERDRAVDRLVRMSSYEVCLVKADPTEPIRITLRDPTDQRVSDEWSASHLRMPPERYAGFELTVPSASPPGEYVVVAEQGARTWRRRIAVAPSPTKLISIQHGSTPTMSFSPRRREDVRLDYPIIIGGDGYAPDEVELLHLYQARSLGPGKHLASVRIAPDRTGAWSVVLPSGPSGNVGIFLGSTPPEGQLVQPDLSFCVGDCGV